MSRIELVPDGDGGRGVTVMLDGSPQSHVDLADPALLAFEYMQQLATVTDTLPAGPLAVTHVGGAGLTLARYLNAVRPGSPQIVLEPDAELTGLVRRELPLPRRHRIRVRTTDGRTGIGQLRDASADVVVVDAYAGGRVPAELTTLECLGEMARVLRPPGVVLLNLADEPGLRYAGRVVAGLRLAFGNIALLAPHEVLKGKRFGNAVAVASREPLDVEEIRRRAARAPFPTGVRAGEQLVRQLGGARPFTDADSAPSPEPPPLGAWRIR